MSLRRDKSAPKGGRPSRNEKVKPHLLFRLWRMAVEHPKGVLIAAATLLGLIVVLGNWRPTRAKLLVWEPELPFIVWALIFMLVGYLTGKWIEWALMQRRIRKGTYKPRVSAEDLAGTTADLDDKLPSEPADEEDPATIIDRSASKSKPTHSDSAIKTVDYWDEGDEPPGDRPPARLDDRDVPDRGRSRSEDYVKAGDHRGDAPSRYRKERDSGGRYNDYNDYQDSGGRYSDYSDYADSGGGRRSGGGRYSDYNDYQDSSGGRRGGSGGRRR